MTGNVSLEFANTADWHAGPDPEERLVSYTSAVDWAVGAGILSGAQAEKLLALAHADPIREAEALRRVIAMRESVYRIFSATAHHQRPKSDDLELLSDELAEASAHLRLVMAPDTGSGAGAAGDAVASGESTSENAATQRFTWMWSGVEDHLTSLLWPVARAATSLLTSPELARVRECAGDPCGWVFLDMSKNASRRWCDMADCGNRAKARRYRERRKEPVGQRQSSG